jgi:hypothetical protein
VDYSIGIAVGIEIEIESDDRNSGLAKGNTHRTVIEFGRNRRGAISISIIAETLERLAGPWVHGKGSQSDCFGGGRDLKLRLISRLICWIRVSALDSSSP